MRKLLLVLVVLGVLAVVVDRIAEHVAEDRVASVVQEKEDLPQKPDVEFSGFPFLTQVMSNDISKVTMSLPEVKRRVGDARQIRVEDLRVTFSHVRTSDNFHRATAQTMTGHALIPYDSIGALGPFGAAYGGQANGAGVVRLSPDHGTDVAGGLHLDVGVAARDGNLTFVGTDGAPLISVPNNLDALLGPLLHVSHQLYGLPASFTIRNVQATPDGIELTLAGRDVELTR